MSKTKLRADDKRRLYFECGGRCSLCKDHLGFDAFSRSNIDTHEYAHIIADSEDGPRGDITKSTSYAGDITNIVLLCPTCHTKVDKNLQYYTVDKLKKIKTDHRNRVVKALSSIKNEPLFLVLG